MTGRKFLMTGRKRVATDVRSLADAELAEDLRQDVLPRDGTGGHPQGVGRSVEVDDDHLFVQSAIAGMAHIGLELRFGAP